MRWTLLAVVLLAACSAEPAYEPPDEPVRVRASVERAQVTPGQPFFLTVEVDRRQDVELNLPDVGASIEGLVVLDQVTEGPEIIGDRVLTRTITKLRAPIEGTYHVPGVEAPWKTPDNQVGTTGTGPILIEATRLGTTEEELRALKPLRKPAPLVWPWVAAAVGAVLVILLALLLARLLRTSSTPVAPPTPADEVALQALRRLVASELLRPLDQGPFAYELSGILRRYLEARYGFSAWRMTTGEVLRGMPVELASSRGLESSIRNVLEASDFVKFAGQPVPVSTLEQWVKEARGVVHSTRPREEVSP